MKNSPYLGNTLFLTLSLAACSSQDEAQMVKAAAGDSVATIGWEEFRKSVRESSEGFFLVEGDIRLNSEQELRDYYKENFTQGALIIDAQCSGIFCSAEQHRLRCAPDHGSGHLRLRLLPLPGARRSQPGHQPAGD